MRKLYYNLVVTAASVAVALLIGGVEALSLVGDRLGLQGPFWRGVGALNDDFNLLGFSIVGAFIVMWVTSLMLYRYARLDDVASAPGRSS